LRPRESIEPSQLETNSRRNLKQQVAPILFRLSDSCLTKLASIPTLTQIICVGNQIENIDSLKQLSALKKLSEVDFSENPVAQKSGYRKTLFDE